MRDCCLRCRALLEAMMMFQLVSQVAVCMMAERQESVRSRKDGYIQAGQAKPALFITSTSHPPLCPFSLPSPCLPIPRQTLARSYTNATPSLGTDPSALHLRDARRQPHRHPTVGFTWEIGFARPVTINCSQCYPAEYSPSIYHDAYLSDSVAG